MTHIARGRDSDGAMLLDIVVNGHILQLPSHVDVAIKVLNTIGVPNRSKDIEL